MIKVKIAVPNYIASAFNKWTNQNKCHEVDKYNSPYATRGAVELIFICKVLKKSKRNFQLEFIQVPNYARALKEVEMGRADISAESVWTIEIDEDKFFSTDTVIKDGWFEKGIFYKKGNRKFKKDINLKKLSAVMIKTWRVDWLTLKDIVGSENLRDATSVESIYRMLYYERGDFTLFEFGASKVFAAGDDRFSLEMLEGIKVKLRGARKFVVSRKSKNSKEIIRALDTGISSLNESGEIKRAFIESGFINQKVVNWKSI